jgi:hypothetical protein
MPYIEPNLTELDQAAIAAYNALQTRNYPDAYEPIENFDEPEWEGLTDEQRKLKFIRVVLETLPDDGLAALCRKRNWRVLTPHAGEG